MASPDRSKSAGSGTIKSITDRGFGFIGREGVAKDLFFSARELTNVSFDELRAGDHVEFEIIASERGPFAANVGRNGFSPDREIAADGDVDDNLDVGVDVDVDVDLDGKAEVRTVMGNLSRQLAELVAKKPNALDELEWRVLEQLLAEVFAGLGFDAELTPGSKDGGKDVIVSFSTGNETKSYFVEIKHWRSEKKVGKDPVVEFLHVVARERITGGIFLATHGFSKTAFEEITQIERKTVGFGTSEKVVSLCRSYVKAQAGIWYPPDNLDNVIYEDTF